MASMPLIEEDEFQSEVQRILRSGELRNSEVLRRLLIFLAEKTVSGEAVYLKEYAVAIDGLGKPPSYDPRQHSTVRIQVGRLRQKLAEYYRGEGKDDTVIIDVPKGRFELTCHHRLSAQEPVPLPPLTVSSGQPLSRANDVPAAAHDTPRGFRISQLFPWAIATLCCVVAIGALVSMRMQSRRGLLRTGAWTPELQEIWAPFISSPRPVIMAIEDPLFAELRSDPGVYYRDKSLNTWKDIQASPAVKSLRGALGNADVQPSRYYTAFGEVNAAFLLGRVLGPFEQNLSVAKTSQLSWQQIADNNVLFIGVQNLFFSDQLQGMPLRLKLVPDFRGVENLDPRQGEPASFTDQFSTAPSEEGVVYALVTHVQGPLGNTDVESFTSNRAAGYVAAVQWFTDANLTRVLTGRLRSSFGGRMPRYYQVLLRVKFKDEVPLETTFVTSRELR